MLHNIIITLTILALKQCTGQEYTATSTCSVTASPNVSDLGNREKFARDISQNP